MKVRDVISWLINIKSHLGKNEYSMTELQRYPMFNNIEYHTDAIKYGLVRKKMIENKFGALIPVKTKNGSHVWEISIGSSRYGKLYNTLVT